MAWRSKLEAQYTVKCSQCGHESIDPKKKTNQKYSKEKCPQCGYEPKRR